MRLAARHWRQWAIAGRPYWVLLLMALVLVVAPPLAGERLVVGNFYDLAQNFAAFGLIALALGLTMIAGEFDLSVPASYLLGSMIAVRAGAHSPLLGLALAVAVAVAVGAFQGGLIARLGLNSMSVTLGGYLAITGAVYVIGHGKTISSGNFGLASDLDHPRLFEILSLRAMIVIAVFLAIALLLTFTRLGPELRATGGDRRAARVAGVRIDGMVVGVFTASCALAALGGALQGYALSYAAPSTATDSLIFAATAALLGGVTLTGGVGGAIGIAAGVLALSALQECLAVIHVSESMTSLITGSLLAVVALASAPGLARQLKTWNARRLSHPGADEP